MSSLLYNREAAVARARLDLGRPGHWVKRPLLAPRCVGLRCVDESWRRVGSERQADPRRPAGGLLDCGANRDGPGAARSQRAPGAVTEPSGDAKTPPAAQPPPPREPSPPQGSRRFRPRSYWIVLALGLLAINIVFGMRAGQPPSRVRVPYTPFFLQQVRAGHVKDITSKGTAIQGTFTQAGAIRGQEADDAVQDRDPRIREQRRARRVAPAKGRGGQRTATR